MLYERYQAMQKQAQDENVKVAQIETLEKFASAAEDLLIENGQPYTADDVVKVASFLINSALEEEELNEKVAEYYEAGKVMANGFLDHLKQQG